MNKFIILLAFLAFQFATIQVTNASSILVDRTHGQQFDEQGFSNYLLSLGWRIDRNQVSPITPELLEGYDIFFTVQCHSAWLQSEIDAIVDYVNGGGALWFVGDDGSRPTAMFDNQLVSQFGVTFNGDRLYDPTDNENNDPSWPTIHSLETHPITNDVSSFGYYHGSSLNVSNPDYIIAMGDDDTYSNEGFYTSYPPVMAAVEFGSGRSVVVGDFSPWHAYRFPKLSEEECLLLLNTAEWLATPIPIPTLSEWGMILFSILLAGSALWVMRRRAKQNLA